VWSTSDETVRTEPRRCCGEGETWRLGGHGGVQSRPSVRMRAGEFDRASCIRVVLVLGCVGELVDLLVEDIGGGW
jgi:hypothetical protein